MALPLSLASAEALYLNFMRGVGESVGNSKMSSFFIVLKILADLSKEVPQGSDLAELLSKLESKLVIQLFNSESLSYTRLTRYTTMDWPLLRLVPDFRGVSLEHLVTESDVDDFICSRIELASANFLDSLWTRYIRLDPTVYEACSPRLASAVGLSMTNIEEFTQGFTRDVGMEVTERNADRDRPAQDRRMALPLSLASAEALYSHFMRGVGGSVGNSKMSSIIIVRKILFGLSGKVPQGSDLAELLGKLNSELLVQLQDSEDFSHMRMIMGRMTRRILEDDPMVTSIFQLVPDFRGVSLEHMKTERDIDCFICGLMELSLAKFRRCCSILGLSLGENPEAEISTTIANASASHRGDLGYGCNRPRRRTTAVGMRMANIEEFTQGFTGDVGMEITEQNADEDGPGVGMEITEQNADEDGPDVGMEITEQNADEDGPDVGMEITEQDADEDGPDVVIEMTKQNADRDRPDVRINIPEQNTGTGNTLRQNVHWFQKFNDRWSLEKEVRAARTGKILLRVLPWCAAGNGALTLIGKPEHPASAASLPTYHWLSSSDPSWDVYFGCAAVILGFAFNLAGVQLRGKKLALCVLMFQFSALATTSSFVNCVAYPIPQPFRGILQGVVLIGLAMVMVFSWQK